MLRRLRYIGRVISLFFRLFIFRSLKVLFHPGPPPPPAPPVIKRAEKTQRLSSTIVVGIMMIALNVTPRLTKTGAYIPYLPWVMLLLCAISILLSRWLGGASRTLVREARQNDYTLCPDCGYCLKGLPDKHQCPECGTAYDIKEVTRQWSEYLATRRTR